MRLNRRMSLIAGMVLALFFAVQNPACARHRAFVRIAPPPAKVVVVKRPACPYRQGAWVAGYWHWQHGKHVWVDGRWIKAKPGHSWIDGHWQNRPQGWEWIPGHWRK